MRFRGTVGGRVAVGFDRRPLSDDGGEDAVEGRADDSRRNGCRRGRQRGAVEPDDGGVVVIVFDFSNVARVRVGVVGAEVTMRDRVIVIVTRARFVDVLRRQRRRKDQERRDEQWSDGAGHQARHATDYQ